MLDAAAMITTKAARDVITIADIEALEGRPYDELIPARALIDLLRATAHAHPDRPAISTVPRGGFSGCVSTISHRDLYKRVVRAANFFDSLVQASGGGTIAFLGPIVEGMMEALLGAQTAGVASTINYLLGADVIADLLAAEDASVLVLSPPDVDAVIWQKAQVVAERANSLKKIVVLGKPTPSNGSMIEFAEAAGGHSDDRLEFETRSSRETVCALFHTGGTTGRPKLVRLTHGNQIHAAWGFAQVHGLDEFDTAINGFPLFHVGGTVTAGLSVLAAGGHIIIPSPYSLRLPRVIQNYWRIVERFQATIVSGVPTSIAALAEAPIGNSNVASVRMALTGGAVLPKAVGERFEKRTGTRLFETYGMTETAAAIAFNPGRGEPLAGSVGFRAPYAKILIAAFGSEGGNPKACAPLTSGLVLVR